MLSRVVEVVELISTERRDASFLNVLLLEASRPHAGPEGFNTKGYANSSLVLHKSPIFLVFCVVLWQKLQRLLYVSLQKQCRVLTETTKFEKVKRSGFTFEAPVVN